MELVAIFGVSMAVIAVLAWLLGEWQGFRRGVKFGQKEYASQLRFERRMDAILEPTGQPHSRRPVAGRPARVSEAHMSQPRADWSAPSND